jgi:uncharacterized DUF497 family protein
MGRTVVTDDGRFEWDEDKNILNKVNHGIDFKEILAVFDDPHLLERYDRKNSTLEEDRLIGLGSIGGILVLLTCYTGRGVRTRIFSARRAEPPEEKEYYEYCRQFIP